MYLSVLFRILLFSTFLLVRFVAAHHFISLVVILYHSISVTPKNEYVCIQSNFRRVVVFHFLGRNQSRLNRVAAEIPVLPRVAASIPSPRLAPQPMPCPACHFLRLFFCIFFCDAILRFFLALCLYTLRVATKLRVIGHTLSLAFDRNLQFIRVLFFSRQTFFFFYSYVPRLSNCV